MTIGVLIFLLGLLVGFILGMVARDAIDLLRSARKESNDE